MIDGGKPKQMTANAPDENKIAGAFLFGMEISQKIDRFNRQ